MAESNPKRVKAKEDSEESSLDFVLDLLSLSRSPATKGSNHMFDYNFSLLQTILLILVIGMIALVGLLFGVTIIS